MSIATWTAGVVVLCAHGVFASQAETLASQDKSSGKAKQDETSRRHPEQWSSRRTGSRT